jgi:DNA-directed RNA polymerase subunit RPC12/RpoP
MKLTCKRCLHRWLGRMDKKPLRCPNCGSKLWETEKETDHVEANSK